jgi:hypothetical protein
VGIDGISCCRRLAKMRCADTGQSEGSAAHKLFTPSSALKAMSFGLVQASSGYRVFWLPKLGASTAPGPRDAYSSLHPEARLVTRKDATLPCAHRLGGLMAGAPDLALRAGA